MNIRSALTVAAIASGSVFAAGTAVAAVAVTLNPQAANGGLGVVSAATPSFQATGGTLALGTSANPAVLTIGGTTGVQNFSETGRIELTTFQNSAIAGPGNSQGTVFGSGIGSAYNLYVDFTFSGTGNWIGNNFAAGAGGSFTGFLRAANSLGVVLFDLGTLSLSPSSTAFGLASISTTDNSANTTFSATLGFAPAVGTVGVVGFFEAPSPFSVNIILGSVGGNSGNTQYTVDGGGVVRITTPIGGSSSTGNFTFVNDVPEPGVLSLAGIALLGLAAVTARRKKRVAATV